MSVMVTDHATPKETFDGVGSLPNVVLVELSEGNKQQLLAKSIAASETEAKRANKILENLESFDPAARNNFTTKSRALSDAPLKLFFSEDAAVVQDPTKRASLTVKYPG